MQSTCGVTDLHRHLCPWQRLLIVSYNCELDIKSLKVHVCGVWRFCGKSGTCHHGHVHNAWCLLACLLCLLACLLAKLACWLACVCPQECLPRPPPPPPAPLRRQGQVWTWPQPVHAHMHTHTFKQDARRINRCAICTYIHAHVSTKLQTHQTHTPKSNI